MAKSVPSAEAVCVVLPVCNAGGAVDGVVRAWHAALGKLHRPAELVVVDDGSTDGTADRADAVAATLGRLRVLRHDGRKGFGACLRTAVAATDQPLVFYTAADYPYTPADLGKLLARIDDADGLMGRKLDVVSGCRTGRPTPAAWRLVGKLVRGFARAALGLPLEPSPTWLGVREHLRAWLAWAVFADPLHDPNSAFKLLRRATTFDRFPIQSDGDFVHVELAAKTTFLTCLIDEIPLTPNPAPIPTASWDGFWKLFADAKFYPPAEPTPAAEPLPADPPAAVLSDGEDGARAAAEPQAPPTPATP